jgi:hypothetical protein
MRSDKQRQASRANGVKSRGPVTAEGKRTSSHNATRHGVLCNALTLKIEHKPSFLELIGDLTAEFQPQTPFEESLIESMAAARWRLFRIWTVESATLDHELDRQNSPDDNATAAALAVKELTDNSRVLDALSRYEVRYERQYLRAHRRLMEIRGHRNPPAPKPFLVPKPAPQSDPAPEIEVEAEAEVKVGVETEPTSQQAPKSLVFQEKPKSPNEPTEQVRAAGTYACEGVKTEPDQSQPEQKFLTPILS